MRFPLRPLIVVSTCETGHGLSKGGDVIGLGCALLAAGASGLILSQWSLEDASTAHLMIHFYRNLLAHSAEGAAVCLQSAQCESIKQNAHPFYWAGPKYLGVNS